MKNFYCGETENTIYLENESSEGSGFGFSWYKADLIKLREWAKEWLNNEELRQEKGVERFKYFDNKEKDICLIMGKNSLQLFYKVAGVNLYWTMEQVPQLIEKLEELETATTMIDKEEI
jgi:hypothetical protein